MPNRPIPEQVRNAIYVLCETFPNWTIREIAAHLKLAPSTVYRILGSDSGRLKGKVGIAFARREWRKLLDRQAQEIKEYREGWKALLARHEKENEEFNASFRVGKPKKTKRFLPNVYLPPKS